MTGTRIIETKILNSNMIKLFSCIRKSIPDFFFMKNNGFDYLFLLFVRLMNFKTTIELYLNLCVIKVELILF